MRAVVVPLVVVLSVLGTTAGLPAGAATAPESTLEDPLQVHLSSISPSTLSDTDEPVTITGTVTNVSDEPWTDIKLYSLSSPSPIVDAPSLAALALTDADQFVGERIVTPGTEAVVPALDPAQSSDFSLTVPSSELAITDAGVYWLGVQALGTSSLPRDALADGRARTFIPLVTDAGGKNPDQVPVSVVVPIRENVWITDDGRVDRIGRWAKTLDVGGRLSTLLGTGGVSADTPGDVPLTWLVDPAVLAAVARLAAGNPARSLAPDPAAPAVEPSEEPAPTDSATDSPAGGGGVDGVDPYATFAEPIPIVDPDQALSEEQARLAALAQGWLDRFKVVTSGQNVLALPFGDLDVSAAITHGPGYYQQAVVRSSQVMDWLGIGASPALAPRDGVLSPAALEAATAESTILVSDSSFAFPPDAPQSMVRLLGHKVVVTSSGAADGGPSPTVADDPLALRQRLLAEAALRLQSGSRSPVVMMLPADWKPTDPGPLLSGLAAPWLDPVTVADVSLRRAVGVTSSSLLYTEEDQAAELEAGNFSAADQLNARAGLLAGLLSLPNLVQTQVADEALLSLSAGHRANAAAAEDSAMSAVDFLSGQLLEVTVDAPDAITLSSESGQLGVDLVNGLDQPVTVRLAAQSDGELQLQETGDAIRLAAGRRTRIRPEVTADRPGIHRVRLMVTDAQGAPTGASDQVQVRAAQISGVIWLLLAAGALLLFGTIAVRLIRRLRAPKARDDEPDEPGEPGEPDDESDESDEPALPASSHGHPE